VSLQLSYDNSNPTRSALPPVWETVLRRRREGRGCLISHVSGTQIVNGIRSVLADLEVPSPTVIDSADVIR
jgi:hypothetical protein